MSAVSKTGTIRWLAITGLVLIAGGLVAYYGYLKPKPTGFSFPKNPVAAFQTKDKFVVSVKINRDKDQPVEGELEIEVLDSKGKVIAEQSHDVEQKEKSAYHRVEMDALKESPENLTLRCQFGDETLKMPLKDVFLAKAHETALSTGKEFHAGSFASLRCSVNSVKSITETVPLPDAEVKVRLRDMKGTMLVALYDGKASEDGFVDAQFTLPELKEGRYKLEVETKSHLGSETLSQDVQIKAMPKILLVTDKPIYKPGQTMHLRALSLSAFHLKPVKGKSVVFEVEDSKGNKVFRKEKSSSDYGVASVDFELAHEVNKGAYKIRAILDDYQSEKTVTVKEYVLPKFKTSLKTNKKYYLPSETIKGELQVNYFFGKPIAEGDVEIKASTFVEKFDEFQVIKGKKTDKDGFLSFELKLPDHFVGQGLNKGNAIVKLEIKVTDTAKQKVTINKTFPISNDPIQLSLIPEAGKLVPGVENRVFVAAVHPDGSPAKATDVQIWLGKQDKGKPVHQLKTNDSGLAEFKFTPEEKQFRTSNQWIQHKVELLGGNVQQVGMQQKVLDLFAIARNVVGDQASKAIELTSEPFGKNVLVRLDKAIYEGGDKIKVDVLSTAGTPTAYVDVVRDGQTMLTKWVNVKDGKATQLIDLPSAIFGTLEIHAYQMLGGGEIIRDSRVIYVQPASNLNVKVKADRDEYLPGKQGTIRFEVTDAQGKPTQAALGVIVVDEAVYALQEMQPGLEKVYFTLQKELLKPRTQVIYQPSEDLPALIKQPALPAGKQQIAEVLLTAADPQPVKLWQVDAATTRERELEYQLNVLGQLLYQKYYNSELKDYANPTNPTQWKSSVLEDAVKQNRGWSEGLLMDPLGRKLTVANLQKLKPEFTPHQLASVITQQRLRQVGHVFNSYAHRNRQALLRNNKWSFPADALTKAGQQQRQRNNTWRKDGWGNEIRLIKRKERVSHQLNQNQFDHHQIVSAGPDGKFDTKDDLALETWNFQFFGLHLFEPDRKLDWRFNQLAWHHLRGEKKHRRFGGGPALELEGAIDQAANADGAPLPMAAPGGGGRGGFNPKENKATNAGTPEEAPQQQGQGQKQQGGAKPTRVRNYFPETMVWMPEIVTDANGKTSIKVDFADSITTWRLTASASSSGGLLGGTTEPLRVFQDFFVDMDLPIHLTQNDEVEFPVAVYNYLKQPQTVTITLENSEWYELMGGEATRSLDLKPGEVTSVSYRIRASKIGTHPLLVKAKGSKMSDAVRRSIEVVPDGQKVEQVATDRLEGNVTETLTIPGNAIPDASKLIVKMYPGVFSQVMEGADAMLRMPNGCFEQTSSSAYPNILVVDYIKTTKSGTPEMLMKSEKYLNAGYQRLLTFERPGGGFDWWGNGEPLVWLSAYGLQEFSDMAKVWPIDRGIIDRTQAYLMKEQAKDGTWSKIGQTHSVSIEKMGDPKLLLTSYVTWSLLDSGMKKERLEKSIAFIRENVKKCDRAYVLALAANALASYDPEDDSTLEVLQRLQKHRKEMREIKACCYPTEGGQSLYYARGDALTVETTAMSVLAMLKTKQFKNEINKSLTYLIKKKGPGGTWGSTQATILALKALVRGSGNRPQKGVAKFTILVNGKEAATGEITEKNSDVMQIFDLQKVTQVGQNEVKIQVEGETNVMYQVVARHFEPWVEKPQKAPVLTVDVDYDRTELSTDDRLNATAKVVFNGDETKQSTYQVIVDLGIAPGFLVDPAEFAEWVASKKIEKFSVTSQQVTLYLGKLNPGDVKEFKYSLKAKYPIKAKTPATRVYEYYTPSNRAEAKPVQLTVTEKK